MRTSRRTFFGWMGTTPLAAKAAADKVVGDLMGGNYNGLGDSSMRLHGGSAGIPKISAPCIPYEQRLIRASDYIKLAGVPDWVESNLRDRSKGIYSLDADIANKRSWSMAVKIMTQRQRNYEKELAKIHQSAWIHRGQSIFERLTGFDWPW